MGDPWKSRSKNREFAAHSTVSAFRRLAGNRPRHSCQGLVNVPGVCANAKTETKPITAVIAMQVDAGKLFFDLGGARRPEGKKIAMLGFGAKRGDQVRNAQALDLHDVEAVEKALHQRPRVQMDLFDRDVFKRQPVENGRESVES